MPETAMNRENIINDAENASEWLYCAGHVRPKPKPTYRGARANPLNPENTPADADEGVPPADKDSATANNQLAMPPMDGSAPPADKGSSDEQHTATHMDVDPVPVLPASHTAGTPPPILPPSPSPLRASCPVKYTAVLALFDTGVERGIWKSAVDAWLTLEHATGFQVSGKALPAGGCPGAVSWWVQRGRGTTRIPAGLDTEDEREDFYAAVVSWRVGGDLGALPSGLNGLTSVLACLAWWYRVAKVLEGAPSWRKLVEDVVWVLNKKHRAFVHKRAASDALENPASKHARVE
ncbi:hypothetical protein B0H14DRAFT_2625155 [Mycena olivaceomarginata]|nr:hypothetical protein B0H14DRAFT_2625155 [Mycena olivaceomarginata]